MVKEMSLTILEAKKKHEASIMKIEGVISIGIGYRNDKTPAIIVGLRQEKESMIKSIPSVLEGYPVEIQIIGTVNAQGF
jgi:hypothetical protein